MNELIAVVDDEKDILDLVSLNLNKSGYQVAGFTDARGLMNFLQSDTPDLIILDLMLPDADGIELCRNIRKDSRLEDIPVIMLTAKSDEMDRIIGLEMGADDYVTKPFSPKELIARVKAILRRQSKVNRDVQDTSKILIGSSVEVDTRRYEVKLDGAKLDLTPTEFRILQILAENRGTVFSRTKLLDLLWGNDKYVLDRTIDVHIKNLRDKLGDSGSIVKNIRGIGYKLEE